MTALYIILGIVIFFVVLFSLKVSVIVEMTDINKVIIRYLFFKFTVVDSSKPSKEKKAFREYILENFPGAKVEDMFVYETDNGFGMIAEDNAGYYTGLLKGDSSPTMPTSANDVINSLIK